MIGKSIAHYKILEQLGSGGMGVVYKAEDTRLRSIVALKFLPPELSRDDTAKTRLEREAQALASLDHPNICTVHALHQTDDGQPFFCMAYYEGQSLSARLASGPLDVGEALRIAHAAAEGLTKAHGKGVIHRDLKPGNIFITDDGTVKILDFGIARLVDRTKVTRRGLTPGTIHYMSPEQLAGSEVDERSDVFSLGVVLYEMLAGRLPFEADHSDAISYKIINADAERITRYRGDAPRNLQKILDKAMAKRPRNRYRTAREFQRDLELVMGKRLPHPRLRRALALAAILFVGAVAAREVVMRSTGGVPARKKVMLLPFTAEANARIDDAARAGLRETLNENLAQLAGRDNSLWVLPASITRKRDTGNLSEVAAKCGVNLFVSGGIREAADRVWVDLAVLDTTAQHPLRAATVASVGSGTPVEWQTRLAASVMELLGVPLKDEDANRLGATSVPEAYEAYLLGCGLLLEPVQAEAAVRQLTMAVEADPAYGPAHNALARACRESYQSTKDETWLQRAIDHCNTALQIDAESSAAWTTLGSVYNVAQQYDRAVDAYRHALDYEPASPDAPIGLSSAYERSGAAEQAEQTLADAVRRTPDYWPFREQLGMLYYRQGKYAEAATQFREVVALTPGDFGIYSRLGSMHYLLGEMEQAKRMWETGFGIHRSYGPAANLGTYYYRLGRYGDAAKWYKLAAEYKKDSYLVWGNLAQAYSRIPDQSHKAAEPYRKAVALAESAWSRDPTNSIIVAFLAGYYADIGDTTTARARISEAVELGPGNAEVLFRAGHASSKLGDIERALMLLGRAVENGYPTDEILEDPELEELRADPRFEHLVGVHPQQAGIEK